MKIFQITDNKPAYTAQIQQLLQQLTSTPLNFSPENLSHILSNNGSYLLGAVDEHEDDTLLGILTLLIYRIPSGLKAYIDDVVIDVSSRGRGVGEKLMQHAIQISRDAGVSQIGLTSHPRREAANRLYRRLGFELRETNVYQYKI